MRVFVLAWVLAFASPALAGAAPVIPQYTEETATSGVSSVYAGEWQYMVGGGAAAFDCNGDGFPDLYLAGGEKPAKFFRNVSVQGGPLRFTEQNSGLAFDRVTGAYPLDVDGDGKIDLMVLRVGENILMRGLGDCRFERANEAWTFNGGDGWSTAFAATWEHANRWPTLAVGNYIDRRQEEDPWGSCTDNYLHRPNAGQNGFETPMALKPSYCPLSMLFTDWNRSGTPSLRVSNDREYYEGGQEQMWKMPAGQPPELYTAAEGWKYIRIWGMGIASYDVNMDGYPEYYLTSMADQHLQQLVELPATGAPKPGYRDAPFSMGVSAHRPYTGADLRPSTGWHTQFEDVNNDGLADLFVAKGNVDRMPDFAQKDPNNLLVQMPEGTFMEAGDKAGVASVANSRGAALADFNLDGKVDLVVVNRRENAQIWRNTSPALGHWLGFRLQQPGANRDAIGAWIEVRLGGRVMRREFTVGGGHAGGQLTWVHFGLGDRQASEVRVIWPGGTAGPWQAVAADSFYVLEPGSAPRAWSPR